jgi:hypothetical protein
VLFCGFQIKFWVQLYDRCPRFTHNCVVSPGTPIASLLGARLEWKGKSGKSVKCREENHGAGCTSMVLINAYPEDPRVTPVLTWAKGAKVPSDAAHLAIAAIHATLARAHAAQYFAQDFAVVALDLKTLAGNLKARCYPGIGIIQMYLTRVCRLWNTMPSCASLDPTEALLCLGQYIDLLTAMCDPESIPRQISNCLDREEFPWVSLVPRVLPQDDDKSDAPPDEPLDCSADDEVVGAVVVPGVGEGEFCCASREGSSTEKMGPPRLVASVGLCSYWCRNCG